MLIVYADCLESNHYQQYEQWEKVRYWYMEITFKERYEDHVRDFKHDKFKNSTIIATFE